MKYLKFLFLLLIIQSCSYIVPESRKYADGVVIGNDYILASTNRFDEHKYRLQVIYKKKGKIMGREYLSTTKKEINSFKRYDKIPVYKTWNGKIFVVNENNERIYFNKPEFILLNNYEELFEVSVTN